MSVYTKTCSYCGQSKHYSFYQWTRRGRGPRGDLCSDCLTFDRYLNNTYGISADEYRSMLSTQGGVCKICGGPPDRSRLFVDHCHVSGLVRGLLCSGCNTGLGGFKDRVESLQSAILYLQKVVSSVESNQPQRSIS